MSGAVYKFTQTRYSGFWRRREICADPVYRCLAPFWSLRKTGIPAPGVQRVKCTLLLTAYHRRTTLDRVVKEGKHQVSGSLPRSLCIKKSWRWVVPDGICVAVDRVFKATWCTATSGFNDNEHNNLSQIKKNRISATRSILTLRIKDHSYDTAGMLCRK